MKKLFFLLAALLVVFGGTSFAGEKELKIFIWSDYMDEEKTPAEFEKLTGVKVKIDHYESNEEMMAKLQVGGVAQYDLIVPSDYIMASLINLKLLKPIDHSKIPNLKYLGTKFKQAAFDPGNKYSVGYMWGTIGLLYRRDRIKDADAKSWSLVFDPQHDPGPFALFDSVREMMGITLLYLGYDFNSIKPEELIAASDLLIKTKKRKNCLGFKAGVGAKNEVVSGAAAVAITYNGDGVRATTEDPENLGFVVPNEGSEIWLDLMCIPAKAPNPDAAHKWINFILEPKNNAEISMWNQLATANGEAIQYIKKEYLENPGVWPPPDVIKKLEFVKDLGKDNRIVDETWTRIKSH